jgi:hypothetical protein
MEHLNRLYDADYVASRYDFGFPTSLSLPILLRGDSWQWEIREFLGKEYWIGTDPDGQQWLIKPRNGIHVACERVFSIIAQSIGIRCQSSAYLKVPKNSPPRTNRTACLPPDANCHLAIWFFDEHPAERCGDDCSIPSDASMPDEGATYDSMAHDLGYENMMHYVRGQMLACLCNLEEPIEFLLTTDHELILIDNEFMWYCEQDLRDSPLLLSNGLIDKSKLQIATKLCEEVIALPDEIFERALRLPYRCKPKEIGGLNGRVLKTKARAQKFLDWANRYSTR